jgi:hypothetical protein
MLTEYVRKGGIKKISKVRKKRTGGRRVGVLVAVPYENDKVRIGWSLCNFSAGDKFKSSFGFNIAVDRAATGSKLPIPSSLIKQARTFVERVTSYYKDKEVEVTFSWIGQPGTTDKEFAKEVGC